MDELTRAQRNLTQLYREAVATWARISRLLDELDGLEAIRARTPQHRHWMVGQLEYLLRLADRLDSDLDDAEADVMRALDDGAEAAAAVAGDPRRGFS